MTDPESPIPLKETVIGLWKSLKWREVPEIMFYSVLIIIGIIFYWIPKASIELFKK